MLTLDISRHPFLTKKDAERYKIQKSIQQVGRDKRDKTAAGIAQSGHGFESQRQNAALQAGVNEPSAQPLELSVLDSPMPPVETGLGSSSLTEQTGAYAGVYRKSVSIEQNLVESWINATFNEATPSVEEPSNGPRVSASPLTPVQPESSAPSCFETLRHGSNETPNDSDLHPDSAVFNGPYVPHHHTPHEIRPRGMWYERHPYVSDPWGAPPLR